MRTSGLRSYSWVGAGKPKPISSRRSASLPAIATSMPGLCYCIRLITRGGYDWTQRYPWIVESALKNRHQQFVVDGEAVVLGVDGVSDFNALHSRKHDHEVQFCAFDVLVEGDGASWRYTCVNPILNACLCAVAQAGVPNHFRSCMLLERCYGGRHMINSLMLLAVEANGVIALRMMKLMRGGVSARREAKLMVSEKVRAAFEATARLMAGASGDEIVNRYRRHVAANAKRLGKPNTGRSQNRARKRTRRRRK
jgi:hypothetical protein